jgi:hypothetical protein
MLVRHSLHIVHGISCNPPRKLRNLCLQTADGEVRIRVPWRCSARIEERRI